MKYGWRTKPGGRFLNSDEYISLLGRRFLNSDEYMSLIKKIKLLEALAVSSSNKMGLPSSFIDVIGL